MKNNRQLQDLHTDAPSADWVVKQHLERDICLIYHRVANYAFVMGSSIAESYSVSPIGTTLRYRASILRNMLSFARARSS